MRYYTRKDCTGHALARVTRQNISITTHNEMSLNIKRFGAARMPRLGVAELDKGWAFVCEPYLDLSHSCGPECQDISVLLATVYE